MTMMQTWMAQWYWREPLWLLLGLLPLLLIAWRRVIQQSHMERYAEQHLQPWAILHASRMHYVNIWRDALLILTWSLLAIAAAGPRLLTTAPENIQPLQGKAMILLDSSRSMQATDVSPSRYALAVQQVQRWLSNETTVETGLAMFAGGTHVVAPPTKDRPNLAELAQLLNGIQLPTHGSALDHAIAQSIDLLKQHDGQKAIIVLTDGDIEASRWHQLGALVQQLPLQGISLHLLGIGTPSMTTLHDDNGRWLLHHGQAVTTRLDEASLKKLALQDQVFYERLNPGRHQSLHDVWQPTTTRIATEDEDKVLWQELFAWFLLPAVCLLLLQNLSLQSAQQLMTILLLPLLSMLVIFPQQISAEAHPKALAAYQAWQHGEFTRAAALYAAIEGYDARMGEGASCFRAGDIDCAIAAFSRAAWEAGTDAQRGRAVYNLGNSYFRQGDFPAAIISYRDATRYQPGTAVYDNNLAFTEEVQQQIELRLQQEAASLAKRMAPGIRTRTVDDNIELTPDMPVALEEPQTPADESAVSAEVLLQYLERHKKFASLRQQQGKAYKRQHDWKRYSNENPMAASQLAFWQRLFELEEEIQVTLDQPREIEGVLPW